MFNLIAEILELIYRLIWDSYGMSIIILTAGINLLLTPLTIKSTKSMLAMTTVQPQVKKLQAQYRNDRMRLNQELSALYREKNINPLGGCVPLLAQAPIFFVLYQVIRGITRRANDIGYAIGSLAGGNNEVVNSTDKLNFNPNYLDASDTMYQKLVGNNEMLSWGLDLAISPWQIITNDIVKGLPYILIIIVLGVLSYVQQKQIAGRRTGEVSPQQRIIMRVFPLLIVVFSFNLPFAMSVYFLAASAVRVLQQYYLTRRLYRPHAQKTEETPIEVEANEEEKPKGLLSGLSGQPQPKVQHGASPLSKPAKVAPPKAKQIPKPKAISPNPAQKKNRGKEAPPPPPKTSKRITPKKKPDEGNRRRRR